MSRRAEQWNVASQPARLGDTRWRLWFCQTIYQVIPVWRLARLRMLACRFEEPRNQPAMALQDVSLETTSPFSSPLVSRLSPLYHPQLQWSFENIRSSICQRLTRSLCESLPSSNLSLDRLGPDSFPSPCPWKKRLRDCSEVFS